jgi:hypothetical protein
MAAKPKPPEVSSMAAASRSRNGYSADEYSDLIFYLANISQLSIACLLGRENGLPRVITLLRDATSADISPHQSSGCATLAREFTDR